MASITVSDFDVKVRNPEITPTIEMDDEASRWARGDHGEDESISGVQTAQVTFAVRMTKGTTAATSPGWTKFLTGCGIKSVAYTTTGIGYQPLKENDNATISIWVYDIQRGGASPTAVCYKMAGCMGNVTFGADGVGKPWMANFTFTGKLVDIEQVANALILTPLITEATCSEKFINSECYIGTTGEKVSSWNLDAGNEIQPVFDQSDDTGIAYHAITSRKPRLKLNPLMTTRDFWGDVANGVTGCPANYPVMVGDTGSGRLSLHVPKGQLMSPALANREGLVSWDLNVKCMANGYTGSLSSAILPAEAAWELLQASRT
jgi:hypothetical protein